MPLPLSIVLTLAQACAPAVAPTTLAALAQVESRFDPLAIGVNGTPRMAVHSATTVDAVAQATALIAAGRSVDLGLAQINNRNLGWLGLSVEATFDPCRNLAGAAKVLQDGYARADPAAVGEQAALRTTLSLYNTGDVRRGLTNGYVARVSQAAAEVVSAIRSPSQPPTEASLGEPPPAWDVFGQMTEPTSFIVEVSIPVSGGRN